MRRRRFLLLALGVAIAACAANQTMQVSALARYRGDRMAILEAAVDAVQAGYEVVNLDPERGLIVTRDRWYEKDGTFEDRKADDRGYLVEDGSILLRYEVQLRPSGLDYKIEITPVMAQFRNGYAAPFKLAPDDLAVPGWIHGKTEKLAIAIYEALTPYRVNTPGAN